ncbi:hypothetical protein C1O66_12295 [Paucibacter aquatile]|jgi:uncharacterized tellurite resistance protein B-like protein|uniref:Co-chaperone DjlA N-terminal domain-containing protein n=1 Tax=Kinneretia aquatilis TaxID=2070761 RepID=A0A2N8KXN8_9BURK|nr:TerB family tellurite resistance protein [Paucibacter aquatile]PND38225.1 hypothetical protein C1O66_12295 [Paucibacter aquatile]WIV97189.1 TerB family tellurite resistance protein [Paucibacter aquatile]
MRSYPRNSPEAAARILSLAALSDGHLSRVEIDTIAGIGACEQLGLSRERLEEVLHGFCEDLLEAERMSWAEVCRLDAKTLEQLMAEVDDPALRRKLLDLCVAVVEADQLIADGEALVLLAAAEHWGLHEHPLPLEREAAH